MTTSAEVRRRQPAMLPEGTIVVEDGRVIIQRLVLEDAAVVEFLAGKSDSVAALVEAVRLGVRILRLAQTSGDVEMVKREFEAMIATLDTGLERALAEARSGLSERLTKFTGEDLKRSLDAHREELNKELVRLFGQDSANSVQRQIDKVMEQQAKLYRNELAQVLERTDDPDNPFAKLRKELREKGDEAVKEVRDLRERIVAIVNEAKGAALEREKGTLKGRTYQEGVFEEIQKIARVFGDTAQLVADAPGIRPKARGMSKEGDVLVELNRQDGHGVGVRVVFEAKDQANVTLPAIIGEVEGAKENRGAGVGVAVFSRTSNVPKGAGIWRDFGDGRYLCVLDKDEPDSLMLEFTYRVARCEALRLACGSERRLNLEAISTLAGGIRQRLEALQQTKLKLKSATTNIDQAGDLLEEYRRGIRSDLDELDYQLLAARDSADAEGGSA